MHLYSIRCYKTVTQTRTLHACIYMYIDVYVYLSMYDYVTEKNLGGYILCLRDLHQRDGDVLTR